MIILDATNTTGWIDIAKPVMYTTAAALIGILLKHFYDKFANRTQRINLAKETTSVFQPFSIDGKGQLRLSIGDEGHQKQLNSLFITTLHFKNKSNKDLVSLPLTITAPLTHKIIAMSESSDGSMHLVKLRQELSIEVPLQRIELELTPLNKGNQYTINIFTTSASTEAKPPQLEIDTNVSVSFIVDTDFSPLLDTIPIYLGPLSFAILTTGLVLVVTFYFTSPIKEQTKSQQVEKMREQIDDMSETMENVMKSWKQQGKKIDSLESLNTQIQSQLDSLRNAKSAK